MTLESPPGDANKPFADYKKSHEGPYRVDVLSHYFNGELGIASNILGTLIDRLDSTGRNEEEWQEVHSKLKEVIQSLETVHEIGNICFEQMLDLE
jgi:hypothetical protein